MKPKIRLKGFEEEWEKKPLRDLCYKEASSISKDSLGTSEGQYPIFGASGYLQNIDYYQQENTYVGIVKDGAGVGRANVYPAKSSLLGTMQYILPKANTDVDFLGYLLNKTDLSIYNTGSTIPHIYFKDYGEQMVLAPGFPEQQSIAIYFKSLDALIQATTKKVAQLKQLKAASLISMFPQEGETKPKVRFKGFEGEWDCFSLGKIATFSKGSGYSKSDLGDKGCPIILYGRLYTNYSSIIYDVDTFAIPKPNSIFSEGGEVIIPGSGETPEDISIAAAVMKKGIILGGDLNILHFDNLEFDSHFMAIAISGTNTHKELSGFAQGKSIVHLHNKEIGKGHIMVPNLSEQQCIASYFQNLDTQIRLQEQRLEKLKQIKAACLEQMFV